MTHVTHGPDRSPFSQPSRRPWPRSVGLWVAAILCLVVGPSLATAGATKVDVCHAPPGDPTNHQLISISENAYDTHVAHGDTPVGLEVCDGVDNDCDAAVDEGIADLVSGTDVGACQAEIQACQGGTFVVTQPSIGPSAEVCDGVDNDCNAAVDEGIADLVSGTDEGECQQGIQSCVGGSFQVVQDEITPAPEICDGLDNDCSGASDEGGEALCDDGVGCTTNICDGVLGCSNPPIDSSCGGVGEICDPALGCVPQELECPCEADLQAQGWDNRFYQESDGSFKQCTGEPGYGEFRQNFIADPPELLSAVFGLRKPDGFVCVGNLLIERPVTLQETAVCMTRFTFPAEAAACLGLSPP